MILYRATNTINGKFYLGISSRDLDKRKKEHIIRRNTGKSLLNKALKKYGVESFVWDVLYESDDELHMKTMERDMIAALKPQYNLSLGGEGMVGFRFTEETKKIFSERFKGKERPKEVGIKIAKSLIGRKLSEEHKQNVSKGSIGKIVPESIREKISSSMKGIKRTPGHQRKLNESKKGKAFTLEHKKRLSESHKGNYPTQETKEKMRIAQLKRQQLIRSKSENL